MTDLISRLSAVRQSVEIDNFLHIALLDEAQFTKTDVEAVTCATASQLHNWVSRGWLTLTGEQNPGKGKRRLFTGRDVIAVSVAVALQPFGMMQVADQLVRMQQLSNRAFFLLTDPLASPGYGLGIVPAADGSDWLYIPFGPGVPDQSDPPAYGILILDVDRLIIETMQRLLLVVAGEAVPPRAFPEPPTQEQSEDEYFEFTGAAYRDADGNRIFRGLTLEESREYERLKDQDWAYRTSENLPRPSDEDSARQIELGDRNQRARLEYLGATAEERLAAATTTKNETGDTTE